MPQTRGPRPPLATPVPKTDVVHGHTRQDNYYWLREKDRPEVLAYLKAENAYANRVLKPLAGLRKSLYREMVSRIKQTDLSVPYQDRGYYYYSRTEKGKQYEIHCRKKGSLEVKEEITLDLNLLAQGKPYLALGPYHVSDDGLLLAYATDETGFREYTLYVKDLSTGTLLPDIIEKVGAVVWAADNKTLFYTTEDETKRQYRLYRHQLGVLEDTLIYEETDELFSLFARRSRDKAYLYLASGSHTTAEVRYLRSDDPGGDWQLLLPRVHDVEYDVDHRQGRFYLRINDTGRNFRLIAAHMDDLHVDHWQEIVPLRAEIMLEDFDLFENHYVLSERRNGLPEIRVIRFDTGIESTIAFPEPVYDAYVSTNREWRTEKLRYGYESLITPRSVMEYDLLTEKSTLLKRMEVQGGFDAALYTSERLFATASDGSRIPVSIVYRREFNEKTPGPLLLTGYGAYGWPYPVTFSSIRLSLLDRGVAIAIAHIRGGGELGKQWHDEGRMAHKQNTFTDFIRVAEHLVAIGYTTPDRLIIEGGSAGGLLMGTVTNRRPDLFKAVVTHVPFVDVVNTMLDASLPLTVGEYEEWGNPTIEAEYNWISNYCPYTNLKAMAFPAMLVKTSINDSQVMYWEPAKYVARIRTLKTDQNPLLLVTNLGAGHSGASGRYDRLKEIAFDYAFMLDQWRLVE